MDIASREAAERTAVIIGAGPGGLAAAILLAAAGIRVRIIERLPIVGGRTSTIEADGFRFDLGPTFFLYPRVLEGVRGWQPALPGEEARVISNVIDQPVHSRIARDHAGPLPTISKPMLRLFGSYCNGYLRRHFHSVRLLRDCPPPNVPDFPLVVFLNHSSWWDPLMSLLVARRLFPGRDSFGPIEADALRRYRFFARLGFFGVANGTARGAAEFLRTSEGILASRKNAIFITPQGQFADSRIRPLNFQRGLGHLASRVERAAFVPLAIEYVFWEERLPEVLIAFGQPVVIDRNERRDPAELTQEFEARMEGLQDQLAEAAQRRQPADWQTLLEGRAGIARFYDVWRRSRALLRGEVFKPTHSDL